jgi:maltose-binding protein MalE
MYRRHVGTGFGCQVAVRQLAEEGLLANLDDMASAGDWKRHLPPLLVKNITVGGHVIAVPVNLHGANWMFYSTKVFSALNRITRFASTVLITDVSRLVLDAA